MLELAETMSPGRWGLCKAETKWLMGNKGNELPALLCTRPNVPGGNLVSLRSYSPRGLSSIPWAQFRGTQPRQEQRIGGRGPCTRHLTVVFQFSEGHFTLGEHSRLKY